MYTKKLVFPLLRGFESCLKQAWVRLKKKLLLITLRNTASEQGNPSLN